MNESCDLIRCDDGSGTGLGKCIEGTDVGPSEKNSCPISRWYYTGILCIR